MDKKSSATRGYIEVFLAGALWGCIGPFMQGMSNLGAGSGLIALMRQGFGCLMMLPVVLIACGGIKKLKVDRKSLFVLMLMGLFSEAIFNLCYSAAVAKVGVATAAVLLYTAPIFVTVLARILYSELVTPMKILAIVLNLAGCTLTVTNGDFSGVSFAVAGVIFGVLAGFFYALITIFGKYVADTVDPYVTCFYNFLFGTFFLVLFTRPWNMDFSLFTPRFYLLGAGIGLFGTVLPYLFYMTGLTHPVEASKVPLIASVETVVAALLGVILFREDLGPAKILGIVLVFLSVVVINRSGSKAQEEELLPEK